MIDWDRKMGLVRVEGVVLSIDRRDKQITVRNNKTGKNATYNATAELLYGISQDDTILLKHQKNTNTAYSIDKKETK